MSSINDKLERVRKPRVHIKYEVETEDGVEEKELPFVVGVLGDFAGDAAQDQKPLKERKFTKIDRDNINDVMKSVGPKLNLRVDNTLNDQSEELSVNLEFNSLEDFEPTQVVKQVPALRELLTIRNQLRDLLTKSDRSTQLEAILEKALQNPDDLNELAMALGIKDKGEK